MNEPLSKKRGAPRMGPNPPARPQDGPGLAHAAARRNRLLDLQLLAPVIKAVDGRLSRDGRAVVVLDGMCGAGKTTLAALLGQRYAAAPIHMDDFFLPLALRTPQRLAVPGGNVHYERFLEEVLTPLASGGEARYRRFDCATGAFAPCVYTPGPVTVIEGSYGHHPAFAGAYERLRALRVFVSVDKDEQLVRLRLRAPEKLERFQSLWIPLENCYFQAYDIMRGADIALMSQPWERPKEAAE